MNFNAHGPFRIQCDDNGKIVKLDEFWDEVRKTDDDLPSAKGLYVFAIGTSGSSKLIPWYVGKAVKQNFKKECFAPHKLNHYRAAADEYERANLFLFLIPQKTQEGNYFRGNTSLSINYLEKYLISLGLASNTKLLNIKNTKMQKEIIFPGFFNTSPGKPSQATRDLVSTLEK